MNRNQNRKPTRKQQRGLHKIVSESAYGFSPVVLAEPATITKTYRKESGR